jgi:hypothetical protein
VPIKISKGTIPASGLTVIALARVCCSIHNDSYTNLKSKGYFIRGNSCMPISLLLLLASFVFGLLLEPEDGGSIFFRNVGKLLDYMMLHRRR